MSENYSCDDILQAFIEATNKYHFSLDISLTINGSIITGTLISAEEYFEILTKTFKKGNKVSKAFSEKFKNASKANFSESTVDYIHMKDAKIFLGSNKPIPSKGSTIWRGNLKEIDGFFLGKIKGNLE